MRHNPSQAIVSAVGGEPATAAAEFPSVSADGVLVAFQSPADNMVDDDVNSANDVFVAQMGDSGNGFESNRMIRVSVYATGDAFDGDNLTDKKINRRIEEVADELVRFTKALRS